ncbi:MAG: zf-HC2 domain-containing protein [Planctomycetes bacterium]|nr:zf-HC2 domain-containing protein [Planctomycetota bacterium]
MDCARCRSLISDRLERTASPALLQEMDAHLSACPSCGRELRQVEKALGLLRSAEREEPPPGLARAILAGAAAMPAAGGGRGTNPRAWGLVLHGVAALVILSLVGILFVRECSWRRRIDRLEGTIAGAHRERSRLEEDMAALRKQADLLAGRLDAGGDERRRLLEDVEREVRERRLLESKLAAAETHSADVEGRLEDAREAHRREIGGVREDLAASRAEIERLASELGELRSLAARHPVPPEPEPEPRRPERAVSFVDLGDRIEMRVRGSRETVVAELFEIARDESHPDMANLALTALENALAGEVAALRAAPAGAAGPRVWLNQGLEDLAHDLGIREAPQPEPVPARRERLMELERAWRLRPSDVPNDRE